MRATCVRNQHERHRRFFDRELSDRPLLGCNLGFYMHQAYPALSAALPRGRVTPDDIQIDLFLEDCERLYQAHRQLDDDYPFVGGPFVYVPWMEAIMGCPIFASETSMWAEPAVDDWDLWHWEPPSLVSNPWAQKLLEVMAALVKHSKGRYPVAATLMRGPADMLSAMRGAVHFPLDFYDCPGAIRRAAELCADVWVEMGKAQLALVPTSSKGYVAGAHGLRIWAPDKVIWLQEDAMALLSPRLFREFFLPLDRRIAGEFPCVAFHLHGSALWAIDDLVTVPELNVIELNYESAQQDVEGTFAGWQKILKHKPLVIWKEYDGANFWPWLDRVLEELGAQGVSIQVTVPGVEEGLAVQARVTSVG